MYPVAFGQTGQMKGLVDFVQKLPPASMGIARGLTDGGESQSSIAGILRAQIIIQSGGSGGGPADHACLLGAEHAAARRQAKEAAT